MVVDGGVWSQVKQADREKTKRINERKNECGEEEEKEKETELKTKLT